MNGKRILECLCTCPFGGGANKKQKTMQVKYKGKTVIKKQLEKTPNIQDVMIAVIKFAGWNNEHETYINEGDYIVYVDSIHSWSVKIYRNSIDTFQIENKDDEYD